MDEQQKEKEDFLLYTACVINYHEVCDDDENMGEFISFMAATVFFIASIVNTIGGLYVG